MLWSENISSFSSCVWKRAQFIRFNFKLCFHFIYLISLVLTLYAFYIFLFILSLLEIYAACDLTKDTLGASALILFCPWSKIYSYQRRKLQNSLKSNYTSARVFHCFKSTVEQLITYKSAVITLMKFSPLTNIIQLKSADVNWRFCSGEWAERMEILLTNSRVLTKGTHWISKANIWVVPGND